MKIAHTGLDLPAGKLRFEDPVVHSLAEKFSPKKVTPYYFEFIGAGIGVVDRVVAAYSKEDVEALGDNVVQMLDIVKNLTQPEMLVVAQRLLDAAQRQQAAAELEPTEPPGLIALAGQIRDPEVRRGLARLRTLIEEEQ
jgi:hypothetical protein